MKIKHETFSILTKTSLFLAVIMLSLSHIAVKHEAFASPITADPIEAATAIQGPSTDGDYFALTEFFGFKLGEVLDYRVWMSSNGWIGEMTGSYDGTSLSVTYEGDLSSYLTDGTLSWISTGTFGSLTWSGSGSAKFLDTSSGFDIVDYEAELFIGTHAADFLASIPVDRIDPFEFEFDATIFHGDYSINGKAREKLKYTEKEKKVRKSGVPIVVTVTDFHSSTRGTKIIDRYDEKKGHGVPAAPSGFAFDPSTDMFQSGNLTTVPEPSTLTLYFLGFLALLGTSVRHNR